MNGLADPACLGLIGFSSSPLNTQRCPGLRWRLGASRNPAAERSGVAVGALGLGVFGGLVVGMVGGLAGALLIARFRAQTARGLAEQIVANANREADTIRRQADVEAKEEALSRREALEIEVDKVRRDLREQERRVEKREDLLEQKVELLNKRELECEVLERGLADQEDKICQTDQQLRRTLAEQRELLQRIGHFSAEEAREMLLRRVEEELGGEVSNRVLKYEAQVRELCQVKARDILTTTIQRCAAVAHRRDHGQHGRYSQR